MALYVKGGARTRVYITHSRRTIGMSREYVCHTLDGDRIETFEARDGDLRFK
jgi:hypothetical protein